MLPALALRGDSSTAGAESGTGGKVPLARPLPTFSLASVFSTLAFEASSSSLPLRRSLSPEDARSPIYDEFCHSEGCNIQENARIFPGALARRASLARSRPL